MSTRGRILGAFPALEHFNLANLLTSLALALNLAIVYLAMRGERKWAFWLYVFVLGIDGIDGKVARALKRESEFGARLDSLCDAISFCLMPALIAMFMGFTAPAALALAVLYAFAGVWRLAYFDLRGLVREGGREYFIGAPTTRCSAFFFVALTLGGLARERLDLLFYVYFAASTLLMLANIRIRKGSLFENSLFLVLPLTALAYLFIW